MKHKFLAILCPILCIIGLVSCTNTESVMPTQSEGLLTHIFEGEPLSMPEGVTLDSEYRPWHDEMAGTYTFLTHTGTTYSLSVMNQEGTVLESTPFDADLRRYLQGLILPDSVVVLKGEALNQPTDSSMPEVCYTLLRIYPDGSTEESENLAELLGVDTDMFSLHSLRTDGIGQLYYIYAGTLYVLDDTLHLRFSLPCGANTVSFLGGRIYVGMSDGMAELNLERKSLVRKIKLPKGIFASACFAIEGYAIAFTTTDGVYAIAEDETTIERLISYANSGLNSAGTEVLHILDREHMLLSDGGEIGFWRHGDDIDLSKITVLQVAYNAGFAPYGFEPLVNAFHRRHPDIRVILTDYSVRSEYGYAGSEESALGQDMITGAYRPDVFVGRDVLPEIETIYAQKLYRDLYPFLDTDKDLGRENLLGCVARTYETDDGELMALFGSFAFRTLIGNRQWLGDRTSWTMRDMLELRQTIPDEQLFMTYATRTSSQLLGSAGYSSFIDRKAGTCSFETRDFIDYLRYLKTLPSTFNMADYGATNHKELLQITSPVLQSKTYGGIFEWMADEFLYKGEGVSRIGYLSPGGIHSGTAVSNTDLYIMTAYCDAPEAAWLFIKELAFDPEPWTDYPMKKFPSRKEDLLDIMEVYKTHVFTEKGSYAYDPEKPPQNQPYTFFTEEAADELYRYLDETVGVPYGYIPPADVSAIIAEEIAAYLADVQSAEVTAEHIQSRVTIWLSEHE